MRVRRTARGLGLLLALGVERSELLLMPGGQLGDGLLVLAVQLALVGFVLRDQLVELALRRLQLDLVVGSRAIELLLELGERRVHAERIAFRVFCQWRFFRQWEKLRAHAHARGVRIVGDAPIFIAHHSAEVWARPDLFELDATGAPTVVAGVPPDAFSADGQRWGNPLYRWDAHQADGFAWAQRLERPEDLEATIAAFLAFDGPAFLEVMIDPDAGVYPMVGPGASYAQMITGEFIASRSAPVVRETATSDMF